MSAIETATKALTADVGWKESPNRPDDVKLVKQLLNSHAKEIGLAPLLDVNNPHCYARTREAIEDFQKIVMQKGPPYGRVKPGGPTFKALVGITTGPVASSLRHMNTTWQEIVQYLDKRGIAHWTPQRNQTTGGGHAAKSFHYAGTAVDLDPHVEIFKALEPLAVSGPNRVLAELFLDKPSCGFYQFGRTLAFVANHEDHCHAALEIGRHMPL